MSGGDSPEGSVIRDGSIGAFGDGRNTRKVFVHPHRHVPCPPSARSRHTASAPSERRPSTSIQLNRGRSGPAEFREPVATSGFCDGS